MLNKNFFDKYGNFENKDFLMLMQKAQKGLKNRKNNRKGLNIEITLFNSASKKEVWQFINKLSIFINSGLDIKGALSILVKQIKNPYLKKIGNEIKINIDYGIGISETMSQHPKVFDNLLVALISVGEKTGNLGKILAEMDKKMLEDIELKSKVKGALIYPVILLFLTFAMVTFMMVFIIPKITESFSQTGTALPALTQVVINISNFFRYKWYILIGGIFGFFIFFKLFKKTYFGELFLGKIAINLPVFGYIVKQSNVIYFINSFSLLMESGVLLLEALKTSSQVVTNIHYKKEIVRVKNEVENGLTISKSLGLNLEYDTSVYINKLFPEEFAYIVNTGEETGTLAQSLKKIGLNYSNELKRYIGNLATMLEPFIIVIVGFLVGTIVIAIMLPFFKLGEIAKKM
ncbi:type II secretion system F family protein [Candidatus Gracilibacteria bacterium]|nr:type II secretion system F family protein [Candidatus Gracilibacteria bacterium]